MDLINEAKKIPPPPPPDPAFFRHLTPAMKQQIIQLRAAYLGGDLPNYINQTDIYRKVIVPAGIRVGPEAFRRYMRVSGHVQQQVAELGGQGEIGGRRPERRTPEKNPKS